MSSRRARDGQGDGRSGDKPGDKAGDRAGRGKGARGKGGHAKPGSRADAAPATRPLRVAEEIRHVLAGLFTRRDFRDPDLAAADLTVTEVRLAPDMKHGIVYVSRLGRGDTAALLPALKRAKAYLRAQVAQSLTLRRVPELSFQPDITLDHAEEIGALLRDPAVARDLEHSQD